MTFAELVSDICAEVNRPEMTFKSQGGTGEAVRAAISSTLTLHTRETYYKDIVEQLVMLPASAYIFAVPTDTLVRYRKMAYIRKWDPSWNAYQLDPTTGAPSTAFGMPSTLGLLKEISPDNIFDIYAYERVNVWYAAGNIVQCKSDTALTQVKVGFYQRPNLTRDTAEDYPQYSSWIAEQHPYAIIYHAASKIFTSIGQLENSRKYDRPASRGDDGGLVQEQIKILDMNNIVGGMG